MFKRILVAYDGSDGSRAALDIGIALARLLGAELSSISVEERLPRYAATVSEVEEAKEAIDEHFRALTKEARDRALVRGVELESMIRHGHEVATILSAAREGRFDLLALGYQGHSRILERVVGSTALSVARLAPCSIMFVRPARGEGLEGIKRILVGVDGSPLGRLAFRAAVDLAILARAPLIGATIQEASRLARPEALDEGYVRQLKAEAEEHARAAGAVFQHLTRPGHAAQALRDCARDTAADLMVLGATGLERPWSATIGGTAMRLAGEAPCSLLLVRSPQTALHVRDVMGRGVSTVTEDAPLAAVVDLLLRRNVKAVPVVDARRRVIGIITGGDLLSRADLDLRLSIKQELDAEALRDRLRALAAGRRSARDVMSRHVRTVQAEADLATTTRLMASRRVKRLPVVNESGELIGIVSRADVLRAIAALPAETGQAERELPATGRTVADAVTAEVPVVGPEAVADEVLKKLIESPLRRVVVVGADSTVRGLISDRDVLARSNPDARPFILRLLTGRDEPRRPPLHQGRPPTAADLMAPSLLTVRPEDSLAHAIRLMMQHKVKRLVVVGDDGRLRGVVDRREILRLLSGEPR
jgi:CBS-domain-containing membrane protein